MVQAFLNTPWDVVNRRNDETLASPEALRDWLQARRLVAGPAPFTSLDLDRALAVDDPDKKEPTMKMGPIVSPEEWKAAREELLVKEKELTHARDALAAERRRMPRLAVEKTYRFNGPNGPATFADLFEGRLQLILYRFFFEPGQRDWPESGCPGCSWVADQMTHPAHLNARDTTLALISRAPQPDIERWKARMGWEVLPWYTLTDDFDADFHVDEWHGTNVFLRNDDGRIFRTYFVDGRGDEALGGLWAYLDITALGRQEEWEDSPEGYPQGPANDWIRRHDEYDASPEAEAANASAMAEQSDRYEAAHGDSTGSAS